MTLPGAKQVHRGPGCTDVLGLRDEDAPPGSEPLLETVMRGARRRTTRSSDAAAVEAARRRFRTDLAALPPTVQAVHRPATLRPAVSPALRALTDEVRVRLERRMAGSAVAR
jgi:nicotinate phosphoribosyltransferase